MRTILFFIFSLPFLLAWSDVKPTKSDSDVEFRVLVSQFESHPGKAEKIQIQMILPKGFHAYLDQLKLQNISPQSYKIGQLIAQPSVEFFDKFSKKNRIGIKDAGLIEFLIESPLEKLTSSKVEFGLRYQICSEKVCYLPKTEKFKIDFLFERKPSSKAVESSNFFQKKFDAQSPLFLSLLFVFIAGILTSFTPCIFPMIPITLSILGHNAHNNSRLRNLTRSITYVLGIATTYAVLGVLAAVTGSLFGKFLAHPLVVWSMAGLFVIMAFSMWGAFEIQAPAFIRNRLSSGKVHGFVGLYLMGLVAGVIASPCVGPVLISILSYVSTTQNIVLGFLYLFTYALGLGLIFIVIGIFSEVLKLLPRSGGWMEQIKFALGLVMVIMALYYLRVILSEQFLIVLSAAVALLISIWKIIAAVKEKRSHRSQLVVFTITAILSALIFFVFLIGPVKFDSQIVHTLIGSKDQKIEGPSWAPYTPESLKLALNQNKPIIIDFFAQWCGACHELKDKTFSQRGFVDLSKNFTLLVVDSTEDTAENQRILTQYNVKGLPTVVFLNRNGETLDDLTFTQFIQWPELEVKMQKALELDPK